MRELLSLGRTRDLLQGPGEQWIYRGHADDRWELVPRIFRDNEVERLLTAGGAGPVLISLASLQMVSASLELRLLRAFIETCNEIGLQLPMDLYGFRQRTHSIAIAFHMVNRRLVAKSGGSLDSEFNDDDAYSAFEQFEILEVLGDRWEELTWPPDDLLGCLSLAQHYGIPTRLLDFSNSPLHAAYFAACDAANQHTAKYFSVVCLRAGNINAANKVIRGSAFETWQPIHREIAIDTPARFGNANVFAQRGVLVFRRELFGGASRYRSEEDLLRPRPDEPLDSIAPTDNDAWGVEYCCPRHLAGEVLSLLEDHEIRLSSVFPSYRSAAEDVMREYSRPQS